MWSNIKEAFSVLSYLDLAALAFLAYEVHARGWPYVKAKFVAVSATVRHDVDRLEGVVADMVHRVVSIEKLLVQAKIAIPAPAEPIVPVTGPLPPKA